MSAPNHQNETKQHDSGALPVAQQLQSGSISAVVLTKNEAATIADCLATLSWADEIVVLDSVSSDGTLAICQTYAAAHPETPLVIAEHRFVNYSAQRNRALDCAHGEWVLFVDADERVPPDLAAEVRAVIQAGGNQAHAGFWIPRSNQILGHWMRGAGWYPDHQLRLLRREAAHYDESRQVHEFAELQGSAGYLSAHLRHYNYTSLGQFRRKQVAYMSYAARTLYTQGVRPKPHTYILQPLRDFRRRYFQLAGYRDGWHGLLLCLLMAYYTWFMYWQLRNCWQTGQT